MAAGLSGFSLRQAEGLLPAASGSGASSASRSTVRSVIAVVYATCLLLALSYPQAIAAWLDEFEPNPVVTVAQVCAGRLVVLSESVGLAQFSARLRETAKRYTSQPG